MIRLAGWLCVAVLAIGAHLSDNDALRGATAFAAIALIAISAPRSVRIAIGVLALIAAALIVLFGANTLLDAVPALIAAFVAFLFARTLLPNRTPLIARAIVAIDGPEWLAQPRVVRYARNLTATWAIYQTALAALALAAMFHVAYLPGPRVFGAILPLAVALLFSIEFLLRPRLLPGVPRHRLLSFARRLILAWPTLLDDR
ncbi:MAG TPA: hypothetical protein VH082_01880 [Rudaea sp.]|jgi:uncharacterized membrane protein|nr:hypothetical protein [Rudaea sp.]